MRVDPLFVDLRIALDNAEPLRKILIDQTFMKGAESILYRMPLRTSEAWKEMANACLLRAIALDVPPQELE